MSFPMRPESRFVVAVSQQVAEVLVPFLTEDSRILRATEQMAFVNPELRTALLNTVTELRAAARLSRAARAELAVVGNLAEEMRDGSEESEVEGTLDPAGSGVLLLSDTAGALIGISPRRVRQLCKSGDIEAEKRGTQWLITREAIDQYLTIKSLRSKAA